MYQPYDPRNAGIEDVQPLGASLGRFAKYVAAILALVGAGWAAVHFDAIAPAGIGCAVEDFIAGGLRCTGPVRTPPKSTLPPPAPEQSLPGPPVPMPPVATQLPEPSPVATVAPSADLPDRATPPKYFRARFPNPPRPYNKNPGLAGYYPPKALRLEQQGEVRAQITFGGNGVARSCTILRSSGYPMLDRETCRLVGRHPDFTRLPRSPIADADGGYRYKARVAWRLGD